MKFKKDKYECENCGRKFKSEAEKDNCFCDEFEEQNNEEQSEE